MALAKPPYNIEIEEEEDGRWIAEVIGLPGVVAYGDTKENAVSKAEAIALRVLADRLDRKEPASVETLFAVT